ncbi:MAG: type I methionyl aminopeptidase [Patescibacteria group bacterium]|nr:type I methionyl aminopeptidase [Patescibacteria group bacterium]MDD5121033.1 type I methionyl aminopeptidase [Patescibacteria group bacterium]MDD5221606.1 type I methionyl aminopeptidase [Patescibacteria group bacterium]MDD5396048.1 type I methionyl aminopeptidase [Patescibacteria group bacterium]
MISIKTKEEIKTMRQAARHLAQVLDLVVRAVKPDVSTWELDQLAEQLILNLGAEPAFKDYCPDNRSGYPATLCVSINQEVVHGIPKKDRIIKEGDVVGIDCGVKLNGYYSDMAITVGVGKIKSEYKKLLDVTKKSLELGIKKVKEGVYLGDVSSTIQNYIEKNGFSVVRNLCGHGIGRNLHEEPSIFNFGKPKTGPILKAGMTLAIEPMVNLGDFKVKTADDGWTIETVDGKYSAHFEHTVLVTKNGAEILTK